ncbi:MAG: c-type cytochrome biogenesis protein CcsB [Mariprofundaceae bacterium]|nr:c-type cytochrome biogenesis protein CcsB [Mariprofundaceae bacterium]
MTAIAESNGLWENMYQGRAAFVRYWAYIGLMLGAVGLAMFGGDGYTENGYIFQLVGQDGFMWLGTGALLGAGLSIGASMLRPAIVEGHIPKMMVSWFDGGAVMLALMAFLTIFEPTAAMVSYEDQTNLFAGHVVMTMNVLFIFSAICYIAYLFAPDSFIGGMATMTAWGGVYAGGSALLLRWYESYLFMDGAIGHAPVSNIYEVFILLCCVITIIYLQLERRYEAKAMGAFVMALVAAAVFFGIWLGSVGQGEIKPLVPALQSYWMKIHVPMNFVGYGSFAVACGAGMAYLVRQWLEVRNSKMVAVFPSLEQLDQLAYKAVAIGFPAFTLATILGAAWASEAWGGYWSWDPKETWALIVWLVYGAYLHVRISHGWHGRTLAWWTVIAFLVTVFCFLGVNMYLAGLHSYGHLS